MRYKTLIDKMTLEEKASLMSGENFWNTKSIERLGIPSMMLTDGPHGLRKQGGKADHLGLNKSIPATCFPTAATLANSWDIELLKKVGSCLGKEAAGENVSVLLGPGLNIKRNPLCGRNFEYFSEDPYLSGKMAASMIQGIQSQGISACPKHFVGNSQETRRMIVDEIIDERALHELYLEGFRYAVKEGKAKTIMTAYNKVNGIYVNENTYLMEDVLRNKWGYDGLIVTDWGGSNDRVSGLIAGNSLEMPSTNGMTDKEIVEAIKNKTLSEGILDKNVDKLLSVIYDTTNNLGKKNSYTKEEHRKISIEAACRSIVLLKNDDNILPLRDSNLKIGIVGDFAETPRYQGAGSSLIVPTQVDNLLEAMYDKSFNIVGYEKGFKRLGGKSDKLSKKACQLAKDSDILLLFLGLDEGSEAEGVDRKHMSLSNNQLELLDDLKDINKNIILLLAGGAPIEMQFIENVKAIVHGYLPGQGGGLALAKVLSGEYNPSGKLAETYPIKYSDVPSSKYFPGEILTSEHRESIYIGYRYFDKANKEVLFPFGFGLSYSEFKYEECSYTDKKVTFSIKNISQLAGEEVVQVYIKPLDNLNFRAKKELKGFSKVYLESGERKTIEITLDEHTFSYYNVNEKRWVKSSGDYEVQICASSRDIRLSKTINITGEDILYPYTEMNTSYDKCEVNSIISEEFEKLVGYLLPPSKWDDRKELGYNDIIEQSQYGGLFGKLLYKLIILVNKVLKLFGKPIAANNVMFVMEMPFRSIARMSGGKVNMAMLDGILKMVNGNFFKGLLLLINAKWK